MRRSNQLSYEATDVGSRSIVGSYVPVKVKNVSDVYEIEDVIEPIIKVWLQGAIEGYRLLNPIGTKLTHLLYIDDLKVFASTEAKLNRVC